jgi:enamine deaminase RidA (YjgF/YER057c/UK114 family)
MRELAPTGVAGPAANYALGMEVTHPDKVVVTAGIVGERPDGSISDDPSEQATEMWRSVAAVLAEAGMGPADIVSYTTYAVVGTDRAALQDARDRFLAGHRAASTLIYVPMLARPQWKVEVAVTAIR